MNLFSESIMSSQPEHKLELESQFILRLPQAQAAVLHQAIKSGDPLAKRLFIKFDNDIRHGSVKFDNCVLAARLFDLPTIIESYKTLDKKNLYKTADISQILVCKEETDVQNSPSIGNEDDEESKKAKSDRLFASIGGIGKREYLYPHGITPPLKNVRKRRFRKTLRKKYVDFSEIEKEVKRLFKFDCEAIDSRYEIVEENKLDKMQPTAFGTAPSPLGVGPVSMQSAENSQNIDVHDLFGEECSSSDESDDDDDDDEKDDDMENEQDNDNENEDENMDDEDMEDVAPVQETSVPAADIAAEIAAASDLISQPDDNEERRQELNRELAKIRDRIQIQESEMKGLDNQALRMRLQPVLESLHEQENEILKQLDELSKIM